MGWRSSVGIKLYRGLLGMDVLDAVATLAFGVGWILMGWNHGVNVATAGLDIIINRIILNKHTSFLDTNASLRVLRRDAP